MEGDSVVSMDGEYNRLAEAVSDTISSEACIDPGWQGWSGVLGDFLLNLSTFVADAVPYIWQMYL